jgi:hypothetical protein
MFLLNTMESEFQWLYKTVGAFAIGIILLLLGILYRSIKEDAKVSNSRIKELEDTAISKETFEAKFKEVAEQRIAFHAENTTKLNEIGADVKGFLAQAIAIGRMDERVAILEKREAMFTHWKHEKIDPYVPKTIDDHDRRIHRLEGMKQ